MNYHEHYQGYETKFMQHQHRRRVARLKMLIISLSLMLAGSLGCLLYIIIEGL